MGLKINRQTNLEKLFDQFAVIEPETGDKSEKKAEQPEKKDAAQKEDKK